MLLNSNVGVVKDALPLKAGDREPGDQGVKPGDQGVKSGVR